MSNDWMDMDKRSRHKIAFENLSERRRKESSSQIARVTVKIGVDLQVEILLTVYVQSEIKNVYNLASIRKGNYITKRCGTMLCSNRQGCPFYFFDGIVTNNYMRRRVDDIESSRIIS